MANCKHTKCYSCGGIKLKAAYIGIIKLSDICSPKCQMATKDACVCKCEGKFHKGANSKAMDAILNPKKKAVKSRKKTVNKNTLSYLVQKFEPEGITDEIAIFLTGRKIEKNSFRRFGDINYIDRQLMRNYITNQKGARLDQLAEEYKSEYYREGLDSGDVIQRMVDFIVENPTGIKNYIKDREKEKQTELEAYNIRQDDEYLYIPEEFDFEFPAPPPEDLFVNGINKKVMKLKKGSKEAKAFMAKLRAARGKKTAKKVGAVNKKDIVKVFYVGFKNRKIREKIEAKSAKDAIKEYQNRLKPIYGSVPATWLIANKENTVGSTLKLKANKKRLQSTPKDIKGNGYHKDTKSHNVNIRVVSGFSKKIAGLFDTSVISDIDALKKEYFKLAKKYHPDAGGSTEQFQLLQAEYEKHLKTLLSGSKLSSEQQQNEIELDEALRNAANALAGLENINIELAGKWLWVTGNTYPIREQLKSAGFLFASNKKAWFYKGSESKGRGNYSMEEIKQKYGATKVMPADSKKIRGIGKISTVNKSKLNAALKKAVKALNKRNS